MDSDAVTTTVTASVKSATRVSAGAIDVPAMANAPAESNAIQDWHEPNPCRISDDCANFVFIVR